MYQTSNTPKVVDWKLWNKTDDNCLCRIGLQDATGCLELERRLFTVQLKLLDHKKDKHY